MEQNQKPTTPSQQDPERANNIDPLQKEPMGPGGDRGGVDQPGSTARKNPGQTNPSHNAPGHIRQDQPRQQEQGQPGQSQTQSYPGVKGPKARDLQHDADIDQEEAERVKGDTRHEPRGSRPEPQR